jgi:hypothetical protein
MYRKLNFLYMKQILRQITKMVKMIKQLSVHWTDDGRVSISGFLPNPDGSSNSISEMLPQDSAAFALAHKLRITEQEREKYKAQFSAEREKSKYYQEMLHESGFDGITDLISTQRADKKELEYLRTLLNPSQSLDDWESSVQGITCLDTNILRFESYADLFRERIKAAYAAGEKSQSESKQIALPPEPSLEIIKVIKCWVNPGDEFAFYRALLAASSPTVEATTTNTCALKSISDDQVRKVVRAFWRRIYAYRNDYGIELPDPLPVEFMAHMATALCWVDKVASTDLQSLCDELLAALKAVVSVADRKTVEFDMAHTAIEKAEAK